MSRFLRHENNESSEDIHRRAKTSLTLLVRWMEAEQFGDDGGANITLEHEAWCAAELLLRQTRKDVDSLNTAIDQREEAAPAKVGGR